MYIKKPWIMIHETDSGIETILAGPTGSTHREFVLAIADAIKHVSRAFKISEDQIMQSVQTELDAQTTPITGELMQ